LVETPPSHHRGHRPREKVTWSLPLLTIILSCHPVTSIIRCFQIRSTKDHLLQAHHHDLRTFALHLRSNLHCVMVRLQGLRLMRKLLDILQIGIDTAHLREKEEEMISREKEEEMTSREKEEEIQEMISPEKEEKMTSEKEEEMISREKEEKMISHLQEREETDPDHSIRMPPVDLQCACLKHLRSMECGLWDRMVHLVHLEIMVEMVRG